MAAAALWGGGAAEWRAAREAAPSTLAQHASAELQQRAHWYEEELPAAIAARAPDRHITQAELVQLVEWKLRRGKWRPQLLNYAKSAADSQVVAASQAAFAQLCGPAQAQAPPAPRVQAALEHLTVIKGVGPATASALLAAADGSGSCPFMSDEAMAAALGSSSSYTKKAYMELLQALRAKAAWLVQEEPGGAWTAVLVERTLYAAALAAKPSPKASKAKPQAAGKAAAGKRPGAAEAGGVEPGSEAATAKQPGRSRKRGKQAAE